MLCTFAISAIAYLDRVNISLASLSKLFRNVLFLNSLEVSPFGGSGFLLFLWVFVSVFLVDLALRCALGAGPSGSPGSAPAKAQEKKN